MTRTEELVVLGIPVISATAVGALGSKSDDLCVRHLYYPGRGFFTGNFPAIDPVPAKDQLLGSLGLELRQTAGFPPLCVLLAARGRQQINRRGQGQSQCD